MQKEFFMVLVSSILVYLLIVTWGAYERERGNEQSPVWELFY